MKKVFAHRDEVVVRKGPGRTTGIVTTVLAGSWLEVLDRQDGWIQVKAFGKPGWVAADEVGADDCLRIFFCDVGQGDGALIETPTRKLIVDAGADGLLRFLHWKYNGEAEVHFDAVVVSHFDADHFAGLKAIIDERKFSFGVLLHNGIAKERISPRSSTARLVGRTPLKRPTSVVSELDDLASADVLERDHLLPAGFAALLESCRVAKAEGRLEDLRRLTTRDPVLPDLGRGLKLEVLGPVPDDSVTDEVRFPWFEDDAKTVNGHSVVLRLTWRGWRVLLGGDLNAEAETYLRSVHGDAAFAADVFKACHHGSSDFTVEFLEAVAPLISVISSGDNETYGHPAADLVGALGRWSRGTKPLVFSTELARSTPDDPAKDVKFGMINVRCRPGRLLGAQMREGGDETNPWLTYPAVP